MIFVCNINRSASAILKQGQDKVNASRLAACDRYCSRHRCSPPVQGKRDTLQMNVVGMESGSWSPKELYETGRRIKKKNKLSRMYSMRKAWHAQSCTLPGMKDF